MQLIRGFEGEVGYLGVYALESFCTQLGVEPVGFRRTILPGGSIESYSCPGGDIRLFYWNFPPKTDLDDLFNKPKIMGAAYILDSENPGLIERLDGALNATFISNNFRASSPLPIVSSVLRGL